MDPTCSSRTVGLYRKCLKPRGHKHDHAYEGIPGKNCTCMLRWYPNRCEAHPEQNQ